MKKGVIVVIGCAIVLLIIGGILLMSENTTKTDDSRITSAVELKQNLMTFGYELYKTNNHAKCVQDKDKCFISLKSLEKDYGYDITVFTDSSAECNVDKSGLYFNNNPKEHPFYLYLVGCKALDAMGLDELSENYVIPG